MSGKTLLESSDFSFQIQGLQRLDKRLRDFQQGHNSPSLRMEAETSGSTEGTFVSAVSDHEKPEIQDHHNTPGIAVVTVPAPTGTSVNGGPENGEVISEDVISLSDDDTQTLGFKQKRSSNGVSDSDRNTSVSKLCANTQGSAKSVAAMGEQVRCRRQVEMLDSVFESDSEDDSGSSSSSKTRDIDLDHPPKEPCKTETFKDSVQTNPKNGISTTEETATATHKFSNGLLNHNHANGEIGSSPPDDAERKPTSSKTFFDNTKLNGLNGKPSVVENRGGVWTRGPAADDDSEYSGSDSENLEYSMPSPIQGNRLVGKKLSVDSVETEKVNESGPSSPKKARTDSGDMGDGIYVGDVQECHRTNAPPLLMPELPIRRRKQIIDLPSKGFELPPPDIDKCASHKQFCMFCPKTFSDNAEFADHLTRCNPTTALIADFKRKSCLVCNCRITNFTVTGLFRHAFQCLAQEWTRLSNAEKEGSAEGTTHSSAESKRKKHDNDNNNNRASKHINTHQKTKVESAGCNNNYQVYDYQESTTTVDRSSKAAPFTEEQTSVLLQAFNSGNIFPSSADKTLLARKTGLNVQQVKQWFDRMRFRRKKNRFSNLSENGNSGQVNRRVRNSYPGHVYKRLVKFASENQLRAPNIGECLNLANDTGLTQIQIKRWFSNMRRDSNIKRFRTIVEEYKQEVDSCDEDYSEEEDPGRLNVSSNFEDLPENKKHRLLAAFDLNPRPQLLEVLALAEEIGFDRNKLFSWFEKQRKAKGINGEEDNGLEEANSEAVTSADAQPLNLELMTHRQKLKLFKKIPKSFITDTLNNYRFVLATVLSKYAQSDLEDQLAYESDCLGLVEALNEQDPYEGDQKRCFNDWEDDWAVWLYPEREGQEWIDLVNRFKLSVLQVWSRVIVFQTYAGISLMEAASTICGLRKVRGNDESVQSTWAVAELIEQLQKQSSASEAEAKDCEDDDLSVSAFYD